MGSDQIDNSTTGRKGRSRWKSTGSSAIWRSEQDKRVTIKVRVHGYPIVVVYKQQGKITNTPSQKVAAVYHQ